MNLNRLGTAGAAIILMLTASWVGAENPKKVVGRVLDKNSPKNKPVGVAGVIVKAFNEQNVFLKDTTTIDDGSYTLEGVDPSVFLVIEHSKTNYRRDPEPFRGVVPSDGVTVYIGKKNGNKDYYKEVGSAIVDRSTRVVTECYPGGLPGTVGGQSYCEEVNKVADESLGNEWRSIRDMDLSPEDTSIIWEQVANQLSMAQLEPLVKIDASIIASEASSLSDPEAVMQFAGARGFNPDVYFGFDDIEVPDKEREKLIYAVAFLQALPSFDLIIEGHADEKGTNEYNMALADKRANTVRDLLVGKGLNPERIRTLAYGEERPVCTEAEEACSELNRRAHFALRSRTPG
jgi:outer membrane protein OmpA-like peptidoglycan-associated protein